MDLKHDKEMAYVDEYRDHRKNNKCLDRVTIAQEGPTCWFNALMTVLLYSDGMRDLILKNMPKWSKSAAHTQIARIITDYFNHENPKDQGETYEKAQSVLKPHTLLENLHKEAPSQFEFDPNLHQGYSPKYYLHKLLKYLHVEDYIHLVTHANTNMLYYGDYNLLDKIKFRYGRPNKYFKDIDKNKVLDELSRTPKVLFVTKDKRTAFPSHYATNQHLNLSSMITYNNQKYKLDSLMLSNFNQLECKMGHEIAGITCNGDRYLYNGWFGRTKDRGNTDKILAKVPCSFMKHDWLDTSKGDFCLDPRRCFIKYDTEPKKQLCFSYSKGERTYIFVRVDDGDPNQNAPKDSEDVTKAADSKPKCPPEKVLNPVTGRCVNRDGKIGKQLLKDHVKVPEKKKNSLKSKCPPEKILNPASGRCVNRDGKIGKRLRIRP